MSLTPRLDHSLEGHLTAPSSATSSLKPSSGESSLASSPNSFSQKSDSAAVRSVSDSSHAQALAHRANDKNVEADFDPLIGTDRGRESSNGGYLAQTFEDSELNPPLAPGSHRYVGPHEPLNYDSKLIPPQGGKNASN